jgi:hypothetical protein
MNATTLQARYVNATLARTLQRYSRLYVKARCGSVVTKVAALLQLFSPLILGALFPLYPQLLLQSHYGSSSRLFPMT